MVTRARHLAPSGVWQRLVYTRPPHGLGAPPQVPAPTVMVPLGRGQQGQEGNGVAVGEGFPPQSYNLKSTFNFPTINPIKLQETK